MVTKESIINATMLKEGDKFTNDPSDSGRASKYGITEAVARDYGYTGRMQDLARELAFRMYDDKFWVKIKGDELLYISPMIAEEAFDTAVNMAPRVAVEFLQRSLNVLNNLEKLYSDIKVDGGIGDLTIAALKGHMRVRDGKVLLKAMNCLQGNFYIELSERRPKDEKFTYGWLANRVNL